MRILGIDPGSNATGYGVVESQRGKLVHVAHGVLRPPRRAGVAQRLDYLHRTVCEVIEGHAPDVAAIEQIFVARSPRSALLLGQARGAVLVALGGAGLVVHEFSPSQVKQGVTGSGRATKDQVKRMVSRLLGIDRVRASDAADALAVAIRHAHGGRLEAAGVSPVPRRRRTAPRVRVRVSS
ncbi:MAG: crossover junction endodeoxyribonuclease RuvC [Myxococcota bacterium]|nr:crossover junction endodeoxyribonuclease RuvC [Deltaproteobacteria bacterium]MCP4244019.1 crossover junction endodeoxyribonuclease RuvC [bacterium]MDP6073858.1 crossover junction endodeoxyribonuclease RuvC [Myxococcota bacterium]MDP6243185.1 crossover junction endodeoxyribonuclease RuvC [Myxococcota bacterium]MDP7073623.1 crossover junction endodeoxyribonuclease RuvC [Myxococcota bacterium]